MRLVPQLTNHGPERHLRSLLDSRHTAGRLVTRVDWPKLAAYTAVIAVGLAFWAVIALGLAR